MSTIVEVQGGYEVYTERGINIEVNNAKGAQGATGATGAQGVPGQNAPERKILVFYLDFLTLGNFQLLVNQGNISGDFEVIYEDDVYKIKNTNDIYQNSFILWSVDYLNSSVIANVNVGIENYKNLIINKQSIDSCKLTLEILAIPTI
jgi:hypothetical protein